MTDRARPRVGLVLGAGGYAGQAFHAGTLAAIAEATGWDPRDAAIIVGTSAGSATGAALRAGLSAHDLYQRATNGPLSPEGMAITGGHEPVAHGPAPRRRRPLRTLRPSALGLLRSGVTNPATMSVGMLAAALLPEGARDTDFIEDHTSRLLRGRWPARPYWVCAVRADTGELTVFGRRQAPVTTPGRAVAASCSVPGFFASVTIGEHRYLDGGVRSSTNADVLAGLDLDLVIVSAPMARSRRARRRTLDGPVRELTRTQIGREIGPLRAAGTPVVTCLPTDADLDVMAGRALDPSCRVDVACNARESTRARLARADFREDLALIGHAPAP
jgi:NTE family protein